MYNINRQRKLINQILSDTNKKVVSAYLSIGFS